MIAISICVTIFEKTTCSRDLINQIVGLKLIIPGYKRLKLIEDEIKNGIIKYTMIGKNSVDVLLLVNLTINRNIKLIDST